MRAPHYLIAAVGVIASVVATISLPRAEAATPPADISASFVGKGVSNNQVIANEEAGKGTFAMQVTAVQTGNDLTLVVNVDGGDQIWNLEGRAGGGRFWASGGVGEGEFVLLAGTAKGASGKISLKGKGYYLADTHYSDLKFTVKQAAE
jgi:hypothetical protein